jgi:Brp/Blh family beta-carotene 15,15'-monooxygenase
MIGAGIPHGSYDLRVAKAKWRAAENSLVSVVLCYLACVFSMSALCIFSPLLGLSLFLVISAFHFAEGESQSGSPVDSLVGALYGVCAIFLPIGLHLDQTEPYVRYFIRPELFYVLRPFLANSAIILTALLAVCVAYELLTRRNLITTFERTLCFLGWIILPPLAGFAVWFIGRHSRQHIELCRTIFNATGFGVQVDFGLISLLAIAGLAPFTLLFDLSDINQLFAATICLIAGLTLPHMIVSHGIRHLPLRTP